MGNSSFSFMHFTIQQDRCAMKVGTDGVLLGAWADVTRVETVLDIGTGTGLIALMISQRAPSALVKAIEMDGSAAEQAAENFSSSKFRERLSVTHESLQQFDYSGTFDLLICNPPFFSIGTPSPNSQRNMARQEASLDLLTLMTRSKRWMHSGSVLALILPSDREDELLGLLQDAELRLKRLCRVHPNLRKEAKRILVELAISNEENPTVVVEEKLVIEKDERHSYTAGFKALTKDFYPVEYGH